MFNFVLLQMSQSTANTMNLVMIGGIIVIFYFFMIRPQQKKQKDQKKFTEELKKGDSVVTTGGLHGKVILIESDCVTIEADKGVKLKFEKTAISFEMTKAGIKAGETKQG